jgi:hypothetical protein
MSKWITENYKHKVFYNINNIRVKSKKKQQKAVNWYVDLLKRQDTFWQSKWLDKTFPKVLARLKKFWITSEMVKKKLDHKWLTLLSKYVN